MGMKRPREVVRRVNFKGIKDIEAWTVRESQDAQYEEA